jgi:HAD superfamily hydrolase (TIGR01509 family)
LKPKNTIAFEELSSTSDRFSGFIFDCDGTLADTMLLHYRAWQRALSETGAAIDFKWDLFVSRAGMSLERTVEELNQQFGSTLDQARVSEAQRCFFETELENVKPVVTVLDFARLVAKRHRVSVASGSIRRHVEHTLELIGAHTLFDIIITPADVMHGKPAPDMFLLAAERMGVPAEECLVLEDSVLGIEAARRANMQAVLVPGQPPQLATSQGAVAS